MNLKKNFTRLFVLCAFVSLSTGTAFAANRGVINDDSVNVRSGGSTESQVITVTHTGNVVEIYGVENDFYKGSVANADNVYVAKQFVDITQADGTVNDDGVNLRKAPSTEGEIVDKVSKGAVLEVVSVVDGWYQVKYKGNDAYVRKDFLDGALLSSVKKSNAVTAPTEVAVPKEAVVMETVNVPEAPVQEAPAQEAPVINETPTYNNQEPVYMPEFVESQPYETPAPLVTPETVQVNSDTLYALVSTEGGLNLRSAPTTDSQILAVLSKGEPLDVFEVGSEWIGVSFFGQNGYVNAEYASLQSGQKPASPSESRGQAIIAYAKRFLGTPYKWSGTSLDSGVDCSGFVYSVMKHFGISLDRSSSQQIHNGTIISKADLRTGDLVFFDTTGVNNGAISHVGIYMGDGNIIHSSSSRKHWGVSINSLSEEYYQRTYVSACRVLN